MRSNIQLFIFIMSLSAAAGSDAAVDKLTAFTVTSGHLLSLRSGGEGGGGGGGSSGVEE